MCLQWDMSILLLLIFRSAAILHVLEVIFDKKVIFTPPPQKFFTPETFYFNDQVEETTFYSKNNEPLAVRVF